MSRDEYLAKQGERIKRARGYKLLTQRQLAEKVTAELGEEFDHNKVSRIEQGKQDITGWELDALSTILEQPGPWLQGKTDVEFSSRAKGVYRESIAA